jgi:hypothetical protein
MTPLLLQRPQASGNSVSPLVKAAKPNLEPRLPNRPRRSLTLDAPAGGWRRFGGPPPASCGWDQIGVRTRRPEPLVPSYGCLRRSLNNRSLSNLPRSLRSRPSARLSRLSRPARLPSGIERHLPHLAHTILGSPRDHQRLVDPRLQLVERRNRAAGYDPIVGAVPLRSLDTRQFTIEEGGKSALLLDLRPPFPRTETRGAP